MNLQENYRRLFTGKARSNDASILFESPYNVKVKKHKVVKDNSLSIPVRFSYEGTISGPDIPKDARFEAKGIAGDVDAGVFRLIEEGDIYTLDIYIFFSNNNETDLVSIVNPNELDNTDEMENISYSSKKRGEEEGKDYSFHEIMTKEKKDELSKIINDVVVKYALSKGLEDGVTEKSGGTFNFKDFLDAKKKKKSKRTGPEIAVFDGEVDGRNRTASGTYGDEELEWELDTDDGITSIRVDGESIEDDDPMYDEILTAVEDEGYEIDLDEGYLQENYKRVFKGKKMNLQENYRRLFKGKYRSNDSSLLQENVYKKLASAFDTKRFYNISSFDWDDIPAYAKKNLLEKIFKTQYDAWRRMPPMDWSGEHRVSTEEALERVELHFVEYMGDGDAQLTEEFFEWMKENIPEKGIGPALYKAYKDLPKLVKAGDYDKILQYRELSRKLYHSPEQAIGKSAYDTLIGKGSGQTGPVEMILMVSHIKDGMASLPKRLLNVLPNKSEVTQIMDKINAGDVDLEPDNELLYQYDELLEKGMKELMKKLKVTLQDDDINLEDDNMTVYTTIDASKMKPLKKLGFEEE